MSYGLQVFESNGTTLRLDVSDRTPRLLVSRTATPVPASTGTTSVTVSGVATTNLAYTDSGAPAKVTAANTVTIYGLASAGTTTLRVMVF